jgi:hypothetical protein
MKIAKLVGAACGAFLLSAAAASAQPFDDEGFGWGPYYNNHLSQWDGRPVGPPLAALPPGAEYYNGVPRVGYPVTPRPAQAAGHEAAYCRAPLRPNAVVLRTVRPLAPRESGDPGRSGRSATGSGFPLARE